jgi:glucose-6-phosphate 1-dehydrogenase
VKIAELMQTPESLLKKADPCTMVIFGAGGDLTKRKLVPALFHLRLGGFLPEDFRVVGVAREQFDDQSFRVAMRKAIAEFAPKIMNEKIWQQFESRLFYLTGDLDNPETYKKLSERLAQLERGLPPDQCGRLCYLAIPPSVYGDVINLLASSNVAPRVHDARERPWVRVIIEKPFGKSLESARQLNKTVRRQLAEHQVYRIDHYLGKETVQNLLVFRFANSIFEPVWNRQHIHHVQITAAEAVGVEQRGRYYEDAGVVRDMFQNHLLQLLTLTAMEPPVTFSADAVRDEKVKVLHAVRPITAAEMHEYSVRGQYGPGEINGKPVPGYREEPNVAPDSGTNTYAALRVMVDNWRWQGVPFYLRSGKRLARRASEIAITFRKPPHLMFPLGPGQTIEPNVLAIRVQPEEGIALRFEVKVPGVEVKMVSVDMDFSYHEAFGEGSHEAYETLLLDCMLGEATLFTRSDEVEAAWTIVDPIINYWTGKKPEHFPNYAAGSWGPPIADDFLAKLGAAWRKP